MATHSSLDATAPLLGNCGFLDFDFEALLVTQPVVYLIDLELSHGDSARLGHRFLLGPNELPLTPDLADEIFQLPVDPVVSAS